MAAESLNVFCCNCIKDLVVAFANSPDDGSGYRSTASCPKQVIADAATSSPATMFFAQI